MKSWKRPSELNFVVLNFVARYYAFARVIFELSTRDATFGFDETLAGKSGYARLEERWSASVLSLAWEVSMSTKHDLRWCLHT